MLFDIRLIESKTSLTEAIFFLSLIMGFIYLAFVSGYEPADENALDIISTGFFTILLISSSGTLWLAERNYKKGNIKWLKVWLLLTILLGMIFLGGQAKEYVGLINKEITLSSSLFGTSFFTLTGFHGLHVLIGLIILSVLLVMTILGDFDEPDSTVISTAGLYWHFVDVVWIAVFTVVYVLPRLNILK